MSKSLTLLERGTVIFSHELQTDLGRLCRSLRSRMRKPKVNRMVLAMCLGCFIMVILYFQSNLKPASAQGSGRSSGQGKSWRSPLQTLYDSDQLEQSTVQVTHQGRRELLEDACRSYTRKRRVLIPEDLKHVIVDDQHGLLYCYVPKVACTNWKRVLMVLTGAAGPHRDPLAIPANEAHVPGNLRTLSEYSNSQINQRLRSYLKFVFVREPFERLVSAYRNKFTRSYNTAFHKRYGTKIIRRHRPNPQAEALERGDDVSFEEFVYYLVDPATQREEPFNEHWERVHSLCHPCLIHYDVVGKYETLEQDSRYVLQLAGVEGQVTFPASAKNTRTTGDMAAQFFNNISPFYQKKLYNLYHMDFLLFNYSTPEYLKF
ncbi:carbohydrate sulfotransferase 11-like [Salvelinus namaycush]|uniref:Carbohydrate sulfotransferase n=1 Tax=Salvelinus namaycush TaxID=8040 RepID=A0A8U1F9E0_SALNM|nr:carbohydrate sulfotransferase 11-like [Salvelinus namaycush]